jgi:hypothetical protein
LNGCCWRLTTGSGWTEGVEIAIVAEHIKGDEIWRLVLRVKSEMGRRSVPADTRTSDV